MSLSDTLFRRDMLLSSDAYFNQLYPKFIRQLSQRHWTPLTVVRKAAFFLATAPGIKILDVGSGVGKFCIAGGMLYPQAQFFGVEQRQSLHEIATGAQYAASVGNLQLMHRNFTQIDLGDYQHFYLFNPFYENLSGTQKIDDSIAYSTELFHYYNRFLHRQLQRRPTGTRVVTYHSLGDEMPSDYHVVGTDMDHWLKYWIKV